MNALAKLAIVFTTIAGTVAAQPTPNTFMPGVIVGMPSGMAPSRCKIEFKALTGLTETLDCIRKEREEGQQQYSANLKRARAQIEKAAQNGQQIDLFGHPSPVRGH